MRLIRALTYVDVIIGDVDSRVQWLGPKEKDINTATATACCLKKTKITRMTDTDYS